MDAREYFSSVSRAVRQMDEARLIVDYGPIRRRGVGRGGGISAPTATEAEARMEAAETIRQCEAYVGSALRRIAGIRAALGAVADAVEMRHVDLMPWSDVASELGVTERTARRWVRTAYEWCDAVGWAHVVAGLGMAES